jgi:hypothetical protein
MTVHELSQHVLEWIWARPKPLRYRLVLSVSSQGRTWVKENVKKIEMMSVLYSTARSVRMTLRTVDTFFTVSLFDIERNVYTHDWYLILVSRLRRNHAVGSLSLESLKDGRKDTSKVFNTISVSLQWLNVCEGRVKQRSERRDLYQSAAFGDVDHMSITK